MIWILAFLSVSATASAWSGRSQTHATAEAKTACHRKLDAECVEKNYDRAGAGSYGTPKCEIDEGWTCEVKCSAYCEDESD